MIAERAHGYCNIGYRTGFIACVCHFENTIERDMRNLERFIVAPFVQTRPDGFSIKTALLSRTFKFRVSLSVLCLLWVTGIWHNEIAV